MRWTEPCPTAAVMQGFGASERLRDFLQAARFLRHASLQLLIAISTALYPPSLPRPLPPSLTPSRCRCASRAPAPDRGERARGQRRQRAVGPLRDCARLRQEDALQDDPQDALAAVGRALHLPRHPRRAHRGAALDQALGLRRRLAQRRDGCARPQERRCSSWKHQRAPAV
eukprot:2812733-Pleurochrysis_carterae.AAC.5